MNTRLTSDIHHLIYSFLPISDLLRIAQVSKKNNELVSSPFLWKALVKRDFYINTTDNTTDDPRENYKRLTLGISREKERFILYMTTLNLSGLEIELKEQSGAFKLSAEDYRNEQQRQIFENDRKEEAIKKAYKKLECIIDSQESFNKYYYELVRLVTETKLNEMKKSNSEFFHVLISGHCYVDKIEETDDEEIKATYSLFNMGFQALCKLDAAISMGILLNNIKVNSTLVMNAFQYPCVKVINKLLEFDIDINKKFWLFEEFLSMHITPLMYAVRCMVDKKQVTSSKQIILLLLQKGADTEMPVFITDDDWSSKEEYDQRCLPIYKVCQSLLANEIQKFDDVNDRKIFSEIMEMIINERLTKSMNHLRTP